MKKYIYIVSIMLFSICYSCKKEGIGTYSGGSYVSFTKEIRDTTTMSFFFFIEDEVTYPIEVKLIGNILTKDTEFHIVADEERTTLSKSLYSIPEKFTFRAGLLVDTVYIRLINDEDLLTNQYQLQLKIKDGSELLSANSSYATNVMLVSDRAEKPTWWTLYIYPDGSVNYDTSVERDYLGTYSRAKYEAFMKATGYTDLGDNPGEYRRRSILFLHWLQAQDPAITEDDGTLMEIKVVG